MQKLDIDKRDHALSILERFNALRKEEKSCDFVIKVSEDELKAHRSVLMAGSDYFNAMLSHDTVEKKSGIVEMKNVNFSLVQKCVDFIYTGEIEVSVKECDNLLYVVNMLQLQVVRKKISEFLEGSLIPKLFKDVQKIALKYGLDQLSSTCDEFALENLDLLIREDSFCLFDLKCITFLISSKPPEAVSYTVESRLSIIIDWIKADIANRQYHLMELVNLLNLSEVPSSFGRYLVENEPLCNRSGEFMTKLYLSCLDKTDVTAKSVVVERKLSEPNAILLMSQPSEVLQVYRRADDSVTELQGTESAVNKTPKIPFVAVALKSRIYVVASDGECHMLNIQRKRWLRKRSMGTEPGQYLRATSFDAFIYVSGESTIEKFGVLENDWKAIEICDNYRTECEIVSFGNDIFCLGGELDEGDCNNVNIYNPASQIWTSGQCMNTARRTPAAVDYKGSLYVAGGFTDCDSISSVEVYDPTSGLWTIISPLKHKRDNFMLCVVEKKLYAVSSRDQDITEIYDEDKRKWSIIDNLSHRNIFTGVPIFLPAVANDWSYSPGVHNLFATDGRIARLISSTATNLILV